ncbi:MAG TPA: hypothetical protein VHQ65_15055, partial [Thermoanaerobaculia bacterium]|nr:hypothetical protein [Thermoanaerobaculia bacterium]
ALGLASRPLVHLVFGAGLGAAAELLTVVAWALPGAVASMLLGIVIAAWRAQRRSLAWLAATLVLALTLELAWIPGAGAAGAARAVVLAHGFGAAGNLVIALTAGRGAA